MGKKSDKRLQRQLEKQAKFEEKKARQAIEPDVIKRVEEGAAPDTSKQPKEAPGRVADLQMEWSRKDEDVAGSWTWGPRAVLIDDWDAVLQPFLDTYAQKTWMEIYSERTTVGRKRVQKHLSYSVTSICKEAQDRLVALEMDDVDKVFRFRLSGPKRLFGIQRSQIFYVLWWDPLHNVYPTALN